MQVLVHTDNHTPGSATLRSQVEDVVTNALEHFRERITRVQVHFSDENGSDKSGENDKRCVVEVRLAGLQPIAVSHQGSSVEQALNGAADKLAKTLKRTLERLDDSKTRAPSVTDVATEQTAGDISD